MRVIHIINEADLGGVQIVAIQKLEELQTLGHDVLCLTYRGGGAECLLQEKGIPYDICANREELTEFAERFHPDIVHGHSCGGGSDAGHVGKTLGVPMGDTIHSMVPGDSGMDFEVSTTRSLKSMRPRSTLIPLSVDINRLKTSLTKYEAKRALDIPPRCYVIGRNGRLDGSKNPMATLETLVHLPTDTYAVISGWGEQRSTLESFAHRMGFAERVKFPGPNTRNLGDVFQSMDCIVYPTIDESTCLGTVEPMFQRIPVVCSLRGGMDQHIIHRETALLGDDPSTLAKHVMYLRENPDAGKAMAENAFNKCTEVGYYDRDRDAIAHLEMYNKVIQEKRNGN